MTREASTKGAQVPLVLALDDPGAVPEVVGARAPRWAGWRGPGSGFRPGST